MQIACAPITWPIGAGKEFKGVYHLLRDEVILYQGGMGHTIQDSQIIKGLDNPELDDAIGAYAQELRDEMELVVGASHEFDLDAFLKGELTPVFFGTAKTKTIGLYMHVLRRYVAFYFSVCYAVLYAYIVYIPACLSLHLPRSLSP